MPRFFLHLWDHGQRFADYKGDELATLNDARRKAIDIIREIMRARIATGKPPSGSAILIEDDTGRLATMVTSEDALDLATP